MVRYLIVNSPALYNVISGLETSVQDKLLEDVLHYGATNGAEPPINSGRFKDWEQVKTCLSWGEEIDETPADRHRKATSEFMKELQRRQNANPVKDSQPQSEVDRIVEGYKKYNLV